jgi:parallel beta-helix repeat protein
LKIRKIYITILFFLLLLFSSFYNTCICVGLVNKLQIDAPSNSVFNENEFFNLNADNDILNVGGRGPNNYSTIQDAINDSKQGDIIFVWHDSSPYYENILINKKIKLIGEDRDTIIIDGRGKGDVVTVNVDDVFLSGLSIINSGVNWLDAGLKLYSDNICIIGNILLKNNFGIYSYDLENSIISDNIITENYDCGIHFPFSNNITISNNIIKNNTLKGIFLYDSNVHCNIRNTISNNIIENNQDGIYFWFSYRTDIFGNKISNNLNGISFNHNSNYNIINNNTIVNNKYDGVFLNSSSSNQLLNNFIINNMNGIYLKYSSDCSLINNSNNDNDNNGLSVNYSTNTYIFDNSFSNNENYGLFLNHSTNTNIVYNDVKNNKKIGLFLVHNSNNNIIKYNNFINQNKHAFFENTYSNKWSNNYWDDWKNIGIYRINGKIHLLNGYFSFSWINLDFYPSEYKYS